MEQNGVRPAIAEIPAQGVVLHDRSWIVTTFFFLVITCLVFGYLNVDRQFSLPFMFGSPSYPDYPGWQNVARRTERRDNLRHVITTFETTETSEQVAEFYNAYLWINDRWYPRYGADYSNPIEWIYDDYCPSELHVQRSELPSGMTRVEVRLIEGCG